MTAMADGNATEMAAAGGGNSSRQLQQWPMVAAMVMGDCDSDRDRNGNGDSDGDRVQGGDGDGNGNGNGDGHGKGDHYKGRVASSCGGNVPRFWMGDTLPPPPWT